MSQPVGFADSSHPDYVCKLHKSLYGLKLGLGFQRSESDFSLFHKNSDGALLLLLVYVDDILVIGDSKSAVLDVIEILNTKFALKSLG